MDFGRALRFPLQDGDWLKKIGIGTLITIVPILNFAAYGYALDVLNNVYRGRETPLPEWNDIGRLFVRGLIGGILVPLVYVWPVLILACAAYLPLTISAVNSPYGEPSGAAAAFTGCLFLITMLVALVISPFSTAAIARYATTDQFNEALPGPVLREVRPNLRPWITVLLFSIGASIAVSLVAVPIAVCTFGLGYLLLIPFSFYFILVQYHWYAQAHRASTGYQASSPYMV